MITIIVAILLIFALINLITGVVYGFLKDDFGYGVSLSMLIYILVLIPLIIIFMVV